MRGSKSAREQSSERWREVVSEKSKRARRARGGRRGHSTDDGDVQVLTEKHVGRGVQGRGGVDVPSAGFENPTERIFYSLG